MAETSSQLNGRVVVACQGAQGILTLYGRLNRWAYLRPVMIEITERIALDEADCRDLHPGERPWRTERQQAFECCDCVSMYAARQACRTQCLHLERIAGARMTKDGEIVLTAGNFRTL